MSDPSSEPLWFLDTLEDEEKKKSANHTGTSGSQEKNLENNNNEPTNNHTENVVKDNTDAFSDFGTNLLSSIIDLNEGNEGSLKLPEIKLTLNVDELKNLSENSDQTLDYLFSETGKNNDASESQLSEEKEKKILENTKFEVVTPKNDEPSMEERKEAHTPKLYIFIKDKNGKSITEQLNLNDPESANQYCEEVGSTVINLNDFLSIQRKQKDDKEISVDSVLKDVADGQKKRVKLVLTIKDKRKNSPDISNTSNNRSSVDESVLPESKKCSSCEETARFKSLLANATSVESVLGDSINDTFQRLRDTVQSLTTGATTDVSLERRSGVSSSSVQRSWTTPSPTSPQPQTDWSSETSDSWVRDDGARCTRTVWNTPSGKRVKTQCVSDDFDPRPTRARPRRRASYYRDHSWNIDDEFDRIFRRTNRFGFMFPFF